jgi:hypothetical protein
VSGDRRFFQYEYNLRLISDAMFNRDATLPGLPIAYRVRSLAEGQAAAVEGALQNYALPAVAVRILSLVPDSARDIRDTTTSTFAALDEARFRADMLVTVGIVLSTLGVSLGLLGTTKLLAARYATTRAHRDTISDAAVLRGIARELASIRREREGSGWTPTLIGRALAAQRVLAAYAIGRPVTQRRTSPKDAVREGAVMLPRGLYPSRTTVSGAVTPQSLASLRSAGSSRANIRTHLLEPVQEALKAFTESQYGRGPADETALDEGLATAQRLATQLARETNRLRRRLTGLGRRAAAVRARLWAR